MRALVMKETLPDLHILSNTEESGGSGDSLEGTALGKGTSESHPHT